MKVIKLDKVDSTFTHLEENFLSLDSFTFVYAGEQTNGKGRENRRWLSEKDKNLLFSFLIKDEDILLNHAYYSLLAAKCISKYLISNNIQNVSVKWPNDVYVNDKKICGILLKGNLPSYICIGIGININQTIFEGEFRNTPTSMLLETGYVKDIDKEARLLFDFIENEFKTFNKKELIEFVNSYNYLKGKKVSFTKDQNVLEGIVKEIDYDGAIVVNVDNYEYHLLSGEISLIK